MDRVERNQEEGFRAELPSVIWEKIGEGLPSRLDVARFRSACKEWRSSLASPPRFPLRVLPPPSLRPRRMIAPEDVGARYVISEARFYAVDTESEADKANRMLVLVEGLDQGGVKFKPFPILPVSDLPAKTVKMPKISSCGSFLSKFYDIRIAVPGPGEGEWRLRKPTFPWLRVVFIFANSTSLDPNSAAKRDVTVVARYFTGRLSLLRLGDGSYHDPQLLNWEPDFCTYADIISYNGRLVTVNTLGSAFVMDYHSLQMAQIAAPLFAKYQDGEGYLMQLVEALGDLYLFVTNPIPNPSPPEFDLKVYKLRSEVQQWHEVQDLGDQVFILFRGHCFCVARDVFAESELMDLKYKSGLHPTWPKLVFSCQSPHLAAGTDSRICVVPIDSIPFHDVQVLPGAI